MKKIPSSITVARRKQRNPLVAAGLFRQAGAHRQQAGGQRREAQRQLSKELDNLAQARERAGP